MTRNKRPETFFIVAGETSGDMHGGKLIDEIKKNTPIVDLLDTVAIEWLKVG